MISQHDQPALSERGGRDEGDMLSYVESLIQQQLYRFASYDRTYKPRQIESYTADVCVYVHVLVTYTADVCVFVHVSI